MAPQYQFLIIGLGMILCFVMGFYAGRGVYQETEENDPPVAEEHFEVSYVGGSRIIAGLNFREAYKAFIRFHQHMGTIAPKVEGIIDSDGQYYTFVGTCILTDEPIFEGDDYRSDGTLCWLTKGEKKVPNPYL